MKCCIFLFGVLFLLFGFTQSGEGKTSDRVLKRTNTKPVNVDILGNNSKKLASEKGWIDGKGIVTTKCSLIVKYLKEAGSQLVVETDDRRYFELGKILFCNLKQNRAAFHTKIFKLDEGISTLSPALESEATEPSKTEDSYNEQDWFNKGLEHERAKNFIKAQKAFEQAIRLKPDFYEVYINLGNVYFVIGDYVKAIESYNYALKHMDYNNSLYNKIGTAYFAMGNNEKALETFKKAINTGHPSPQTHFSLGLLYFINGNNEEAFNAYVSLTKIDQELAERLFDLLYR